MAPDSTDALLEKLCQGDDEAAGEAFRSFEPYLRMVVRRGLSGRLRAKFDSVDIVQSVWTDLLEGFRAGKWSFSDSTHLRAFLVKVTRNRFLNCRRHHRHALEREESFADAGVHEAVASNQPRPSETAQADDAWRRMLELCPPAHREILRLKREGVSLAEIATRSGLHESSVRRILYDVARRLAGRRRQGAEPEASSKVRRHGDA